MKAPHDPEPPLSRGTWPGLSARAMALVYLVICLSPVALAGLSETVPLDRWEAFGAGLGLAGLVAMVVQFVTSGRFRRVSGGMGIDRIMAFHKFAAWWVLLALMVHPLAYVLPTFLDDPGRGAQRLLAYHLLPTYRSGVAALAALMLLVAAGVARDLFRYEIWRGSHVVLAMVALGGGLHHATTAGRLSALGPLHLYWWGAGAVALAVISVLYGWRWLRLHRQPWRLRGIAKLADRIWELDLEPAPGTARRAYRAGEFVWITVGSRRFPLFDHPFSIADSPQRDGMRLIIKEVGDFTRTVGGLPLGTPVGVDGPYGTFTLQRHPAESVLLIAGGVGIAPIMSLLRDRVARRDPRPVRLAYAVGTPANFACLAELEAAKAELDLQVMLISESAEAGWTGEVGYLDRSKLEDLLEGLDPARSVALICGPGPMVTAVSDRLLDLGLPMRNVVYERFDYGGLLAARQDRRRTFGFLGLLLLLSALIGLITFLVL
ncbi:MAG: ferric reductase-like transmembrane domain-containing protein [Rhodobacterales bacterium]|nr:ferric reductase-like transmembrane domain-containing protein [Rhodobacterales bacterium]MDX5412480.1 ferric reductase-like transmembrane domain-containing protein [Rhodobacterales bacterium]